MRSTVTPSSAVMLFVAVTMGFPSAQPLPDDINISSIPQSTFRELRGGAVTYFAEGGFTRSETGQPSDDTDGAFVEIGEDNDDDGGRDGHLDLDRGRLDLFDDDDAGRTDGNDGRGASIEAFPDQSDEDGTTLDVFDAEDPLRVGGSDDPFEYNLDAGDLLSTEVLLGDILGESLLDASLLGGQ